MYNKNLSELMDKINYQFKDINLLKNALTHSSYANEKTIKKYKDNERLEFLGDAVLELTSSDYIYKNYSNMNEGQMTRLRASIVCEPTLAICARAIGIDNFIMLGKGEELTGGRKRDSIVSDACEAVIEVVQAAHKEVVYEIIGESGPEHDKDFIASAKVDGMFHVTAKGHTKKHAEQHAAYEALVELKKQGYEFPIRK